MVAGLYKKARPAQDCQEEEKIVVVRPIVPKGLRKLYVIRSPYQALQLRPNLGCCFLPTTNVLSKMRKSHSPSSINQSVVPRFTVVEALDEL